MSKAVLLSVQPKYCNLIAIGQKTLELRKDAPKLPTPFRCYLYCTLGKFYKDTSYLLNALYLGTGDTLSNGNVVGEFICDHITKFYPVPEYTEAGVYTGLYYPMNAGVRGALCLGYDEIERYGNYKTLYTWGISDLVIYDKPKDLDDFYNICPAYNKDRSKCKECEHLEGIECWTYGKRYLMRPPQSWCYVEENKP